MDRREFVAFGASPALLSFFAGCGSAMGDGVDLRVKNRDSSPHSYEITATDYEGRVKTGDLSPNGEATARNFLPYQDYAHSDTVAVTVDDTLVRETTVFVESDVRQMDVRIFDGETVEIGPDSIFSPTPPDQ